MKHKSIAKGLGVSVTTIMQALLSYMFCGGYALKCEGIAYEVTYRCNLRCAMCTINSNKPTTRAEELTISDLNNMVWDKIKTVHLTGGEPLIREDIFEIIKFFKSHNLFVRLSTNLAYPEKVEGLLKTGVNSITTSLNGPPDVHDKISGVNGSYKRVHESLELLCRDSHKPLIRLNCVISSLNQGHLSHILDVAKEIDAKAVTFQFLDFTTPKQREETKKILGDEVCHDPSVDITPEFQNIIEVDNDVLFNQLENVSLKSKQYNIPIYLFPLTLPIDPEDIKHYFSNTDFHKVSKCIYPFLRARVDPYGNVYPCLSYNVGNIKTNHIKDIWNNEKYRGFRKELKSHGIFPVCYRCCELGYPGLKYLFAIH